MSRAATWMTAHQDERQQRSCTKITAVCLERQQIDRVKQHPARFPQDRNSLSLIKTEPEGRGHFYLSQYLKPRRQNCFSLKVSKLIYFTDIEPNYVFVLEQIKELKWRADNFTNQVMILEKSVEHQTLCWFTAVLDITANCTLFRLVV